MRSGTVQEGLVAKFHKLGDEPVVVLACFESFRFLPSEASTMNILKNLSRWPFWKARLLAGSQVNVLDDEEAKSAATTKLLDALLEHCTDAEGRILPWVVCLAATLLAAIVAGWVVSRTTVGVNHQSHPKCEQQDLSAKHEAPPLTDELSEDGTASTSSSCNFRSKPLMTSSSFNFHSETIEI